ncbi:excinuclease [Acinetobacter larvae]|uniref:Excinuclease n=1 Tax=Acinetobacter larvae TaxID=1789224 RepID=A0A1B2M2A1_9GAMM|nr:excinuclease [Acinetobacter larvae]AOA59281.1 excinuclease [Acinetobacter larvae]
MSITKQVIVALLGFAAIATAQAADKVYDLDFNQAVQSAIADGVIDGSVKFYLAGNRSGGKVLQKGVVSNKKTNGFGKAAETACDHVLRSGLIQLDAAAKAKGANAVTNIVSYFKANENRSSTTYQCYKGTAIASVALKGDLVKF